MDVINKSDEILCQLSKFLLDNIDLLPWGRMLDVAIGNSRNAIYLVKRGFEDSNINLFQYIEIPMAFPELKVPLTGVRRISQNDIFILARGINQLITIMVEGKMREPFAEIITDWKHSS